LLVVQQLPDIPIEDSLFIVYVLVFVRNGRVDEEESLEAFGKDGHYID